METEEKMKDWLEQATDSMGYPFFKPQPNMEYTMLFLSEPISESADAEGRVFFRVNVQNKGESGIENMTWSTTSKRAFGLWKKVYESGKVRQLTGKTVTFIVKGEGFETHYEVVKI